MPPEIFAYLDAQATDPAHFLERLLRNDDFQWAQLDQLQATYRELQSITLNALLIWEQNRRLEHRRNEYYKSVFPFLLFPMAGHLKNLLALKASVDSSILLRSLFERAINLEWVAVDPENRAKRFLAQSHVEAYRVYVLGPEKEQKKVGAELKAELRQRVISCKEMLLTEKALEKLEKDGNTELVRSDFRPWTVAGLFQETPHAPWHKFYKALCSWVHPTFMGMAALTVVEGGRHSFRPFHAERAADGLYFALRAYLGALWRCAEAYGAGWKTDVEKLGRELESFDWILESKAPPEGDCDDFL
ncbi:MAG: hypothetical protein KIS97_21110 [Nitrospira sp.]|nr:hypothetical protein [Nitrospira sp.]MCW5870167.1 hypothetical protein [Candidatus Eremiobacteraeota bacterium]